MDFEDLLETIKPKLKQLALRYDRYLSYCSEEDMLGEMMGFLWAQWRTGKLDDKTESYIVQACYFHLRNYLRKAKDMYACISIDAGPAEEGRNLKDSIPDAVPAVPEYVEGNNAVARTMDAGGLNRMERIVFEMLLCGYTVREIGEKLDVSHTMVVKHKKNILKKVSKINRTLLV